MRLLKLNLNEMTREEDVHNYLKEQLGFPEHYGKNLDALYDMLTSELNENVCVELIRCEDEAAAVWNFAKKLENVLGDAAQTIEERDGKVYAVFANIEPLEQPSMW